MFAGVAVEHLQRTGQGAQHVEASPVVDVDPNAAGSSRGQRRQEHLGGVLPQAAPQDRAAAEGADEVAPGLLLERDALREQTHVGQQVLTGRVVAVGSAGPQPPGPPELGGVRGFAEIAKVEKGLPAVGLGRRHHGGSAVRGFGQRVRFAQTAGRGQRRGVQRGLRRPGGRWRRERDGGHQHRKSGAPRAAARRSRTEHRVLQRLRRVAAAGGRTNASGARSAAALGLASVSRYPVGRRPTARRTRSGCPRQERDRTALRLGSAPLRGKSRTRVGHCARPREHGSRRGGGAI